MKNFTIGVLIVAVLGLGEFVLYDKTKSDTTTSSKTNTNATTATTYSGKTLDLSNKGLSEVGPDIYNRTDTVELILSDNQLKSLKSEMGKMTKLQVLKLDHNRLEGSLIAEIRKMPLKELDASYNDLTGIPAEIGQLTQLETLNLSYNRIDTYPNELANIQQLKTLNLTGNPFSAQEISEIKAKLPNTNVIF